MGSLSAGSLRQPSHQRFTVSETADVGEVRRAVAACAGRLQTGQGLADRAGLAATELATNLLYHAVPGGWILARPLRPDAVEILAVDRGPGIGDVAAALSGRSARRHGLGCGLSAVARASSYFDIDTGPGRGTTVLAVVASGEAAAAAARPPGRWAGVSVGIDEACGDAWAIAEDSAGTTVAVVDGIGHGAYASAAADAAVRTLAEDPEDLDGYLPRANAAMRGTRGAVLAVCRLEPGRGELRCLSVGNISGAILCAGARRTLVPDRGAVGTAATPPRARITCYPWPPGATLVLWTDGLCSHIDLADHAGLLRHAPAVAAAALHREHSSDRDDSTVVVVRN
jgi:anti-sigma regulatory factor (Ser/Thr protein kinase)